MRNLSLKFRMMAYSTVMVLIVVGSLAFSLLYQHNKFIQKEFNIRTDSLTRTLAHDLELYALLEDKTGMGRVLEGALTVPDVVGVFVYNADNELLISNKIEEFEGIPHRYLHEVEAIISIETEEMTGDLFEPVESRKREVIGKVRMIFSSKTLTEGIINMVYLIAFFTVVIVVVRIASDYIFTAGIIKPLERLVEGAEAIAGGDLNQIIEIKSSDEVGKLSVSFNKMTEALRERDEEIRENQKALENNLRELENSHGELDNAYKTLGETAKELESYKNELEEKVKERTLELEGANKKLIESYKKIKEVDRLKSEFLANMSHELRTPLNSIIGFSRVILKGIDGPITELQKTDLDAIYNSGQHLLGLINDVLDLSKIESGKMELMREKVDVPIIIQSVVSTFDGMSREKGLKLEVAKEGAVPIISADKTRLRQVLLNIIGNALKFTSTGVISITSRKVTQEGIEDILGRPQCYCPKRSPMRDQNMVLVAVEDTGVGIKYEDIPKVFETFQQVDASSTRREGGTGLGMAISHQIVELHGGEMFVESTPGKGSCFYFTLPLKESMVDPLLVEEIPAITVNDSKGLVAVIDDEANAISLYKKILEKEGYQVVGIQNSETAMADVLTIMPDFIILDVLMPNKDGWELIQELKGNALTKNIPVIFCTIISNKSLGLSLGATDYLVKPVSDEDLVTALRMLNGSIKKIVIIDDSAEDAELVGRILKNHNYNFRIARDGREGVKTIEEFEPDLVILDLMMPEMDGFSVVNDMKKNSPMRNIPIIVLSGKELTASDRKRLNGHVERLLKKELFSEEELIDDIIETLKKVKK